MKSVDLSLNPFRLFLFAGALLILGLMVGQNGCSTDDADGDGYPADVDCNDGDPAVYPGAEEPCVCDDVDQDCDGETQDFACDLDCGGQQEGEVCGGSNPPCAEGLVCCYPCGVEGCDFVCSQPCNPEDPACEDGCYLYP